MISVIIPCYNYGKYLHDAYESISNQTHSDWEIIFIDDGSTDDTYSIMSDLLLKDPRIKLIRHENQGVSISRKIGLDYASGDYIQFLDADDLIDSNKFNIQLGVFNECPNVDIVYGSVRYFYGDCADKRDLLFTFWGKDKEWMPGFSGFGHTFLDEALKGSFSPINSFLFRRTVFDKVPNWCIKIKAAEDYYLILQCVISNCNFYFLNHDGSHALVRRHDSNTSLNYKWVYAQEVSMRQHLMAHLDSLGNKKFIITNQRAIKSLQLKVGNSWLAYLISGSSLDNLKVLLKRSGLDRPVKSIFYRIFR